MPRGKLTFRVKPGRANIRTTKYARELVPRERFVQSSLCKSAADKMLEVVKEKLPDDEDFKGLKNSLEVMTVRDLPSDESAAMVAVREEDIAKKVRELPDDRTILTVMRPNTTTQEPKEEIAILRLYNPWTKGSIPFYPEEKTARIVYTRVSKEEVSRVHEKRIEDLPTVLNMLAGVGVRISQEDLAALREEGQEINALLDTANLSLRAEFGLAGFRSSPHWRPAQRTVREVFVKQFMASKKVQSTMMDPRDLGWRKKLVGETAGTKKAQDIVDFQNKVKLT
jgi:hypothetical protein